MVSAPSALHPIIGSRRLFCRWPEAEMPAGEETDRVCCAPTALPTQPGPAGLCWEEGSPATRKTAGEREGERRKALLSACKQLPGIFLPLKTELSPRGGLERESELRAAWTTTGFQANHRNIATCVILHGLTALLCAQSLLNRSGEVKQKITDTSNKKHHRTLKMLGTSGSS